MANLLHASDFNKIEPTGYVEYYRKHVYLTLLLLISLTKGFLPLQDWKILLKSIEQVQSIC